MSKRLSLLLLVVLLLSACGAQATPTATPPPAVADDFAVSAEGRLRPRQYVQLAFVGAGRIAEVLAAEGDVVAAGQVIARLETSESLRAQVASSQLELLNAQQALADLRDAAAVVTAQAAYDVAQARDALAKAEKDARNIQNPASKAVVDAVSDAKLGLETAQANLQLANVSPDVQAYEQALVATDHAFRIYQDLQARYDDSNGNLELLDVVKQAHAAYQTALDNQSALQLRIDTAKANQADAVTKAQQHYDDAVANLNAARRGPDANKLSLAEARLALAQATVTDAERRYAAVQSGPDADQLRLAEARLSAAQAALDAAQAALANAELRAPFAGTLASLSLKAGEQANPGQAAATLADFSSWIVETDNLTEIEVVKIAQGQGATVVFDALPGQSLRGSVASVGDVFEEKRGDITYTARLALADQNPQLRWGMTAEITFDK